MTRLLVRVTDAGEAAGAAAAGADIVELRFDAWGASERAVVAAVRAACPVALRLAVRYSAIDLMQVADDLGVDELVVAGETVVSAATPAQPGRSRRVVLVARLDIGEGAPDTIRRLLGQVHHVTVERGVAARLIDRAGIAQHAVLAEACRAANLPFGFAGGLEAPDIPRLLMLKPDVLGFDAAVRSDHRSDGVLLPHAVETIRHLIPREGTQPSAADGASIRDTIFVRDFVVALSIGAYRAEEAARQRVRFSVEAAVERRAGPPRDMRDVFSYDVILETIRVLAERTHVAFVETLAEEVAAALLGHVGIVSVVVQVEKLDVVDGAVGIRIARDRVALPR